MRAQPDGTDLIGTGRPRGSDVLAIATITGTEEYAREELAIPGAIMEWDVSQHAPGVNGVSISVTED